MGGNDAFVVLKDANLQAAVDAAYRSRMSNGGQACNAAKRFIITAPVYDQFKDLLLEKIRTNTVIGNPMDRKVNLGPMVSEQQLLRLQGLVDRAIGAGANHIYGELNIKTTRSDLAEGNFTDAIVLEGMNPASDVFDEEFFGPVFNLYKVGNSKDALDLANKSDYGLSSTIFTEDKEKA
jgi:acyl-CoA reductase-like NAD-dependent aldehyde dehydrogenase